MENNIKNMNKHKIESKDLMLYAITDRTWLNGRSLMEVVRESLEGGATILQLREKTLDKDEFIKEAVEMKELCREYGVPLIINDSIEVAMVTKADGVHIGQNDMELSEARKILGQDKIIGVSARTVEQAVTAERNGADYLGVGAVFGTNTKDDAKKISFETLKEICNAVSIPVVAIGGVTQENVEELKGSGIAGAAVISAIYAKEDVKAATRELSKILKEGYFDC